MVRLPNNSMTVRVSNAVVILLVMAELNGCSTPSVYARIAEVSRRPRFSVNAYGEKEIRAQWDPIGVEFSDTAEENHRLDRALSECVSVLQGKHKAIAPREAVADKQFDACMRERGWVYWVQEVSVD